jgi:AbiU2
LRKSFCLARQDMPSIRIETETQFETLLQSLSEDAVTASIHWRLYKDLWACVNEFVRELNQSPAFWSLTMDAHREVALFRLGRLFDQQNSALSLASLVDTIAANLHLFDVELFRVRLKDNPFVQSLSEDARRPGRETVATDAREVSESDPLVARLIAVRNRALAHRDPRIVLRVVDDPTAALSAPDIDALLARAAGVVNRYSSMFKAHTHMMSMFGQDDFRRVLEHVRADVDAIESRIDDEIARANEAG